MNPAAIPDPMRAALGLHCLMRRMRVPAADIFVHTSTETGDFTVILGPIGFPVGRLERADPVETERTWREAVTWWNESATGTERGALLLWFNAHVDPIRLVSAVIEAKRLAALTVN